MKKIIIVCFSIFAFGCANPGIVKVGEDTYLLTKSDRRGIFGNASALKAEVIQEANDFAESQNKIAVPLNTEYSQMYPGKFASYDYHFKLVDKKQK